MKKILTLISVTMLVVCMSFGALAASAWGNISVTLPYAQGDASVGTIAKSSDGTQYATVDLSSISLGYTAVRVWAVRPIGTKLTDVKTIALSPVYISYTSQPASGLNVTLKMDNPVNTTERPAVAGRWTPN